jgi:hypothetical protein
MLQAVAAADSKTHMQAQQVQSSAWQVRHCSYQETHASLITEYSLSCNNQPQTSSSHNPIEQPTHYNISWLCRGVQHPVGPAGCASGAQITCARGGSATICTRWLGSAVFM